MHKKIVKELVFNGGGARGAGMPGVYYALKSANGLWDNVETLAGTSVGSITSALFSVSPELDELKADTLDKDFLDIISIKQSLIPFSLSLESLKNFINDYLKKHILNYLQKCSKLPSDLSNLLARIHEKADYEITFNDLAILHHHFPKKFKKIITTSTMQENHTGKLCIYDAKKTPNCSVAQACIASSAIPGVFKSVWINDQKHLDGGCIEPLPSEYFENNENTLEQCSQRLLFVFGPGPSFLGKLWHKTLFSKPSEELIFVESLQDIEQYPKSAHQIFLMLDSESQKVAYVLSKNLKKTYHISFAELNIPSDENFCPLATIQDEKTKSEFYQNKFTPYRASFFTQLVLRKHARSILGDFSFIWLFNYFIWLIKLIVGIPLFIANIHELLCQRLKNFYTFNTIILHSVLTGASFHQAEKIKRTVVASYYLDTLNHLALYNFIDACEQTYYQSILRHYFDIYKTLLFALNQSTDTHLKDCEQFSDKSHALFEKIKEDVAKNPQSMRAMAMTLAVEFHLNLITPDKLLEEINSKAKKESVLWKNSFYRYQFQKQSQMSSLQNLNL